ncbi:diacylglycerol/lipid kinase family protein [Demetria terragena]|uniref:diacylglycerol/lipid kinase family protein n=1 Tax=Demetria terragena TaxID=63959 RepID=UPI000380C3FA|nr:diacylglycerol kinase family protein [Demetria terragena]
MQRAAVIANPTKVRRPARLRADIEGAFRQCGWAPPLWLETTVDDPGFGQGREAVAQGVDLVLPVGGDGTVRCVAGALRGTGVTMGLLPAGTGNLLARNLKVPVRRRYVDGVRRAIDGRERSIDVGVAEFHRNGVAEEQVFLVMAGIGLEADMLGETPEALKARLGWMAYVVASARHLRTKPVETRVVADGHDLGTAPLTSVIIGNCGTLTGGVRLMPLAEVDDGRLDAALLLAGSFPDWGRLVFQVLSKRSNNVQVRHVSAREFDLTTSTPRSMQVDGDIIREVTHLRVRVDSRALRIRA